MAKIPNITLEVLEGRPGSGKSFYCCKRIMAAIIEERRPVFTNCPLRFRVFKRYLFLRGGADGQKLANLLSHLTQEHFNAFLKRAKLRAEFLDRAREEARALGRRRSDAALLEPFFAAAGPDVVSGKGANWIPPFSLIVIDEAHHWFPATAQVARIESPDLLSYLTMHRHHLHSLIFATQNRMQLSITIRRLASSFWHIRNRRDDKVAWGLRLGHFGVSAFGYARYTPEQEDARDAEGSAPAEQRTVLPWLPSERWVFRLYDSFTHLGGFRAMERRLASVRDEAGVNGVVLHEVKKEGGPVVTMGQRLKYLCLGAVLVAAIAGAGKISEASKQVEAQAEIEALAPVESAAAPVEWKRKIQGVTASAMVVDREIVKVGSTYEDSPGKFVTLRAVAARRAVLYRDGWLFVASPGAEPDRVGEEYKILAALKARRAEQSEPSVGSAGVETAQESVSLDGWDPGQSSIFDAGR